MKHGVQRIGYGYRAISLNSQSAKCGCVKHTLLHYINLWKQSGGMRCIWKIGHRKMSFVWLIFYSISLRGIMLHPTRDARCWDVRRCSCVTGIIVDWCVWTAADPQTVALGAIIGICAGLIICVIALIVFVIIFCNLKIKDDNNIRKRLIENDAFDEEKTISTGQRQSVDALSLL